MSILTLETNKYAIKIDNFEGPLDLLLHLIDKNKMSITDVKIADITDQYIEYLKQMKNMNLDIASEFLLMASTLLYIKSRSLLPKDSIDEENITEEELLRRIIEYKKYKEIMKTLKEQYEENTKRYFKPADSVELPRQEWEDLQNANSIYEKYKLLIERNEQKINENARNIETIVIPEVVTVTSKVKQMFKALLKKNKFVFNKMFSLKKCEKVEVVTAFTGLLEMSRRNKVIIKQEELFGDITVEKRIV